MAESQLAGIDPQTREIARRETLPWYGIRVRTRCEARTHSELRARGFEPFLPVRRVRRRWSDRVKTVDSPVFPGYLFCRFDLSDRFHVLNVPGVAQILGAGSRPEPVSDTEIGAIQALVGSGVTLIPWPYLHAGQSVHIEHGPLAGVEGIIVKAEDGRPRVVVSVSLLRRSVSAEIDRGWIGRAG